MGLEVIRRRVRIQTVGTHFAASGGIVDDRSKWTTYELFERQVQRLLVPAPIIFRFECICAEGALENALRLVFVWLLD
jgi:hypothetical protein